MMRSPLQNERRNPRSAAGLGLRSPTEQNLHMTPLVDDLVEEVLLRLPPHEPASLVRAALVCKRWLCLISDAGFRRRFREFHRRPPMLGLICKVAKMKIARFVPMSAFFRPRTDREPWHLMDARHGRVLLGRKDGALMVWDPIKDKEHELPLAPYPMRCWNAAVLCSAAVGACDHLDCHRGPFLVVFVCSLQGRILLYTYSSDAAVWSDPVCARQPDYCVEPWVSSALVGNALYFRNLFGETTLKYDLELCQMSWIQVPFRTRQSMLTTLEDGGLGIATEDGSNLYIWSRKDAHEEVDAIWERRVAIELKTAFPADVTLTTISVIGTVDGVGIIFMRVGNDVYTIDIKTYKVQKVYEGATNYVFPYLSFYIPELGGTCTCEEPSAELLQCM